MHVYIGTVFKSAKPSSSDYVEGMVGKRSAEGFRASRLLNRTGFMCVLQSQLCGGASATARVCHSQCHGLRWRYGPSAGHQDAWFVPWSSRQQQVMYSVTPGRWSAVVGRVQVWRAVGHHGVRGPGTTTWGWEHLVPWVFGKLRGHLKSWGVKVGNGQHVPAVVYISALLEVQCHSSPWKGSVVFCLVFRAWGGFEVFLTVTTC